MKNTDSILVLRMGAITKWHIVLSVFNLLYWTKSEAFVNGVPTPWHKGEPTTVSATQRNSQNRYNQPVITLRWFKVRRYVVRNARNFLTPHYSLGLKQKYNLYASGLKAFKFYVTLVLSFCEAQLQRNLTYMYTSEAPWGWRWNQSTPLINISC